MFSSVTQAGSVRTRDITIRIAGKLRTHGSDVDVRSVVCRIAPDVHVQLRHRRMRWPLAGFILMIDEFRPDNGATRFVPGSHQWANDPEDVMLNCDVDLVVRTMTA